MTKKRTIKSTLSLLLALVMLVGYLPGIAIPVKAVNSDPGTPFTPKWYANGSPTTITSTGAALKFTDVLEYYYEGQTEALYTSAAGIYNTWSVTDQTDGSQLHKLNDGLTNWTQAYAGFYVKAKAAVSVTFKIDGLQSDSDTHYSAGVYDMSAGTWDVIWGDPNAEKMTDQSYYTASAPATLMAEARTVELEKGDVIFLGFYAKGGWNTGNFKANITLMAEAKEQLATYNISPADGALVDNVWKNNSVVHFPMTSTVTKDGMTETVKGKQQVTDNDQLNASFEAAAGSEVSITYKLLTVAPGSTDPEQDSLSEFPVVPGYIKDGAGVVQNPEWTWSSNTYTYTFTVGEDDVGKTHNWTYDIVPQYYPITVKKTGDVGSVAVSQSGNLKAETATVTGSATFVVDKHNAGNNVTFTAGSYQPLAYDVEWYLGNTKVADGATYTAAPDTLIAGGTVEAKFIKKMFSVSAAVDSTCSGMGSVSVGSSSVGYGESVSFTATPATGYEFVGWFKDGTLVNSDASYWATITEATYLTAKFKISTRNVYAKVHTDCTGMGTATVTPGTVNYGDSATFNATANDGYEFTDWYNQAGTVVWPDAEYLMTGITENTTLVAKFQKKDGTVSFNKTHGSYTVTYGDQTGELASVSGWVKDSVTVAASYDDAHFTFGGWYANSVLVSGNQTYTFTLGTHDNQTLVAQWNEKAKSSITFQPAAEGGSYKINGNTIEATAEHAYHNDVDVTWVATPANDYHFVRWYVVGTNGTISTEASLTRTIAGLEGKTVSAEFAYNYVSKEFTGVTGGTYTISGSDQTVTVSGNNVTFKGLWNVDYTLTAAPADGYKLVGWNVNGTVTSNTELTCALGKLADAANVYPVFAEKYVTLNLPAIEDGSYTLTSADGSSTVTVSQTAKTFEALRDTQYTLSISLSNTYAFLRWEDANGTALGYTTTLTVDNVHNGIQPVIEDRGILQALPGTTNGSYTIQADDSTDKVLATVTDELQSFAGRYDMNYILTAIPDSGYHFVAWVNQADAVVSYDAVYSGYKLSESTSVSPVFASNSVTMRFPAVIGASYTVNVGGTTYTVSDADVYITGDYAAACTITVGTLTDKYEYIGYLIDDKGNKIEGSDAEGFTFKLDADKVIKPYIAYYGTDITLGAAIGSGSYTFGVKDGGTICTVTDTAQIYKNLNSSTNYVLTATAADGYKFAQWQTAEGKFLSDEPTLEGKMPASVVAMFVKEDSAVYSLDGVLYYHLDTVAAAAQSGTVKTIVVEQGGNIYHSDGVTTDFEIPAGVTFIVPHKAGVDSVRPDSDAHRYACVSYISEYPDSYATPYDGNTYIELKLPAGNTLTVNGIMAVGGTLNGAGAIAGGHPHANVHLGSGASIEVGESSYGYLTVCGFVYGPGNVEVKGKGTLYQPFAFNDFRGGGYTVGTAAKLVTTETFQAYLDNAGDPTAIMPFTRYALMGVHSDTTVRYGGYVYGLVDMFAGGDHNKARVGIITTDEKECLFALKDASATATITYEPGKTVPAANSIGRTKITLNGNTVLGGLKFYLNVGVSATIDSRMAVLPIPYNWEIEVAGGTFTVANKLQLMPGATIRVNEGAAMNVASQLTVYKGLTDHTSAGVSVKGTSNFTAVLSGYESNYPGYNVVGTLRPYPTTAELTAAGFCGAGELIVNGTLNLNSGSFGGVVQTESNNAVVNVASGMGLSTYTRLGGAGYWQYTVGQAGFMYELAGATKHYLAAQLVNAATSELTDMVAGKTYYGTNATGGTIESYSYTLCHAANNNTVYTTDVTVDGLSIATKGAWGDCVVTVYEVFNGVASEESTQVTYMSGTNVSDKEYYSDESGTTKVENIDGDTTVYHIPSYTVTWMDGESKLGTSEVLNGKTPAYPVVEGGEFTEPTKEGYKFIGWATEANAAEGKALTELDAVTADITYYAVFAKEYAITYDCKDGAWAAEYEAPATYVVGTELILPVAENLSREGWTFVGWYANAEYSGDMLTTITDDPGADIKLTARWKQYVAPVGATCTTPGNPEYWTDGTDNYSDETLTTKLDSIVVEQLGHTPAEAVRENEVAASCYAEGSYDEVVYCSVCKTHEISREAKTIEKIAHTPAAAVEENRVESTCTVAGSYDSVVYCSVEGCKAEISRTKVDLKLAEHTPGEAVVENEVAATCYAAGSYDEVVYCSVCETHEISRTKVELELADHSLTATEAKDATCTAPGNSAYWTCGTCSKYFSDAEGKEEIEKNSWILEQLEHSYTGEWVITDEGHAKKCVNGCNGNDTVASHIDSDSDNLCDECEYTIPGTGGGETQINIQIAEVPKADDNGIKVAADEQEGILTVETYAADGVETSEVYIHLVCCTLSDNSVVILKNGAGSYRDGSFVLPQGVVSVSIESCLLGDLDKNGRITLSDIVILRKIIAGTNTPTELEKIAANIDNSFRSDAISITLSDMVYLRKYIAGTHQF